MHQETTSPSPSSRNFFHVPKSFRRTVGMHCSCQIQSFSVLVQSSVSFSSELGVDLASARVGALLTAPLLIHRAARLPGRLRASAVSWQGYIAPVSGDSNTRCGRQRGSAWNGAVQHRPILQEPPRGRPLPCTCCRAVVVAWKAQSTLPAADVPVRPFRRELGVSP